MRGLSEALKLRYYPVANEVNLPAPDGPCTAHHPAEITGYLPPGEFIKAHVDHLILRTPLGLNESSPSTHAAVEKNKSPPLIIQNSSITIIQLLTLSHALE